MRTTYTRTLVIAALAAALLAGCGGGSGPEVAAPAPTTTATAPTTTPAPTTTAAPTTTTTAPEPTTTTAPSTTTAPAPAVEDAIKQAIIRHDVLRDACLADPTACDPSTYARGAYLESEKEFVTRAIGMRAVGRNNPEDPSYWVFKSVTVAGATAKVEACFWSTGLLIGPGDATINDEKVAYTTIVDLALEGDQWWINGQNDTGNSRGVNTCGPQA